LFAFFLVDGDEVYNRTFVGAAFEIILLDEFVGSCRLEAVSLQHQVDGCDPLDLDFVHSVDIGQDGLALVVLDVLHHVWKHLDHLV
jgi:hypothetical protein